MKSCAFSYVRPPDLGAALEALAAHDDTRVVAGGQSLVPALAMRLARPGRLLDISRIEGLRGCEDTGEGLELGAALTHAQIEDGAARSFANGYLTHVAGGIAYRAIRNRGTMGGSLSHADPVADWPVALLAAGAAVRAASTRGSREIALDDFFTGPFSHTLAEDEILTAIRVPRLSGEARWSYVKLARKAGEFAQAIAAIVVDRSCEYAGVAVAGVGGRPRALPGLAAQLLEGPPQDFGPEQATAALHDARGGAAPRIVAVALQRAVEALT